MKYIRFLPNPFQGMIRVYMYQLQFISYYRVDLISDQSNILFTFFQLEIPCGVITSSAGQSASIQFIRYSY